jgi:hypothetical protein
VKQRVNLALTTLLILCLALISSRAYAAGVKKASSSPTQIILLVDSSVNPSIGTQLPALRRFLQGLPAGSSVAVAYNFYGRAALASPFTTDKVAAGHFLHIPSGSASTGTSPYFAVSDLSKHWPSRTAARREIVLISNGEDGYYQNYPLPDPYVTQAVQDAKAAGITVDSIYWSDRSGEGSSYLVNRWQSRLLALSDGTGGRGYWVGTNDPVDLGPFLREIANTSGQ